MCEQKRLDKPELEGEVDKILTAICNGVWHSARCGELITDNVADGYFRGRQDGLVMLEANVEEAKKQERERAEKAIEFIRQNGLWDKYCKEVVFGQALKGEK